MHSQWRVHAYLRSTREEENQNQTTRLSPQLIVTICDNGLEPRGSAEPRELTIGVCRDHPRPNRQNDLVHSVSDQQVLPEGREAVSGERIRSVGVVRESRNYSPLGVGPVGVEGAGGWRQGSGQG